MRIRHKRKEDVPGRTTGDFKPWLDNAAASKVAMKLIGKGCFMCGAAASPAKLEGPDGKTFWGEQWYPMQELESGEERLSCVSCYLDGSVLQEGCAVCKATPASPEVASEDWNIQYDGQTNFPKSVLCPTCYAHHALEEGCQYCGFTGELSKTMPDRNELIFAAPPIAPAPVFVCRFCLKNISNGDEPRTKP